MLLASSIRAFFDVSNKLLLLLPNVRFYKINLESRKKIPSNLNASSSRSLCSLSTFSTISRQLHTIDDKTVQESYYIPHTENQIFWKKTRLEVSEGETGRNNRNNDPSLNQNKSAENEPRGADEYTLNVGRGNFLGLFLFYLPNF
jgi:hypothetical protein